MNKVIILKSDNPDILADIGEYILNKWPKEIKEISFDPGNSGMEVPEQKRMSSLQFECPNTLSGEIIMLSIKFPGIKIEMEQQ